MGFSTGFTGGVTLTLGLAYLTVISHERNRRAQADALRSQSRVLNGLFEPAPIPPPQSRSELAREERSTLVEAAKDRWNAEVENAIRWVQRKDWNEVREEMEGAVSRILGGGLQKSREGIEEAENRAAPRVQEAVDRSRAAARDAASRAAGEIDGAAAATINGANRAISSTISKAEGLSTSASTKLSQAGQKATEARVETSVKAQDAAKHAGGTVDAARAAVRGAVSQGIEKGKEVLGKAQAAVEYATERVESKTQAAVLTHSSAVEKALHERYENKSSYNKTAEEILEERYKPIDKKDNTVLRGV